MSFKTNLMSASVLLALGSMPAVQAQNRLFEDLAVPGAFSPPKGMVVGLIQLDGEAGAGALSTNNVYQDSSHFDGTALQTALSTTLTSSSDTHLVTGTVEYFSQDFSDQAYSALDITVESATLFGRFVTSDWTNLRLLVIDEEDILGADQTDQLNGYSSGTESNRRYEAIFEVAAPTYFANAMWREDTTDSESFSGSATALEEDALDRTERDLIGLAGRTFGWGKAFVFAGTQAVRYQSTTDPQLAGRNSDEHRYGVGLEYAVAKLAGDASMYRFSQDFDSAAIRNVENVWVGSGKLNYAATDRLALQLAFDRRFSETNIANVSGIIADNLFVGASVAFLPSLYLRMGPGYSRARILKTPVDITRYSLDIEAGWTLREHLKLLFKSSIFMQQPEIKAMQSLTAQQSSAAITLSYVL